jgi:O-antigen biosynthesis protein
VHVIQNLWRSTALGRPAERASAAPIRRLAFFGQLREGKGIRVFLDSLRQVDRSLLHGVEILFLGHSRSWTEAQLRDELAGVVETVRLEPQLDQTAALAELQVPGTLAVMPSLLENSPYAVAECIEHGVPFLAADVGGTAELVAGDDRARVLSPPTTEAFASALTRVLASDAPPEPARPGSEPERSLTAWLDLVAAVEPSRREGANAPDRLAIVARGAVTRAQTLAQQTRSAAVEVVTAGSRRDGVARADADWVVFLDDEDEPDPGLLDALVAAQAASGADVVTVAVRPAHAHGAIRLFLGDPGALGLVENHYGVVGLVRRSLVAGQPWLDGGGDPDWVLFARLALSGAHVVSIPEPLATDRTPADGARATAEARLAVLAAFEGAAAEQLQDLPQLTATLAAALARTGMQQAPAARRRAATRLAGAVRRLAR